MLFRRSTEVAEIQSIKDLQHEQARRIAERYELEASEILPRYFDLVREVQANGGTIEIDPDNITTPLNIHNLYIRKIACAAVINYEISKRSPIKFPQGEGIIGVTQEATIITAKVKGILTRVLSPNSYEQLANYYLKVIETIECHFELMNGKTYTNE